nr:hypothetical protein [Tanacetum cinerariifolium]
MPGWSRRVAAGTEEEQAKKFQWGLRRSTLNHLMCMSYTDVAQVANAARNYEILHERDDDDTEQPDKRRGGSDNHRSSNNNYSGSNNRNSGNGRDQRNRGHQSNRSTNSGSQQSSGPSEGYSYPVCTTCGRKHQGECRRAAGNCFKCGQAGHLQKDCKKNTTTGTSGQADKKPGASGRVFAITEGQAANTSGKTKVKTVPDKYYILLPLWTQDPLFFSSSKDSLSTGFKPVGEEENKDAKDPGNEDSEIQMIEEPRVNQEENDSVNSTNRVNAISSTINVANNEVNIVGGKSSIELLDDPNMPDLEDFSISEDSNEDFFGADADLNNMESTFQVSHIPIIIIHKDHPFEQVIKDLQSAPQIRRMSTRKEMCTEFEKMMHKKFQMSAIRELTFFLGLQVKQKEDRIFISQDKYLKGQPKLGLWYPKDSPFDLVAYTDSDYTGASLDRKSTTGEDEYVAALSYYGQVLWIQNQLLDFEYNFMQTKIHIDNESTICIVKNPVLHSETKHTEIRHYIIRYSNEKKLIQMIKIHTDKNVAYLLTKAFDGTELPQTSIPTKTVVNEAVNEEMYDNLERATITATSLDAWHDRGNINTMGDTIAQTRSENVSNFSNDLPLSRVNTLGCGEDRLKLRELMELCTKLSNRVLNLETTKTAQVKEIANLKKRVKRLERKRKSRTHGLKRLYKVGLSARVESSADEESLGKEDSSKQERISHIDANQDIYCIATTTTPDRTFTISMDEITLAKALIEIKTLRPKEKGLVMQVPSETPTSTPIVSSQQSSKKIEDENESAELKRCLEIVLDDGDDVTIDATPLSSKSPTIVDYKIYKEGMESFFQIIRADGNSQMYLTFSKMLKNFDREDMEVLWRFSQQGLTKVKSWKLFVTMQNILYYLLVEKMYPLTNHTLHQMFKNVKLQVDEECEMAYELLRLVKKQLKEGYIAD